MIDLHKFSLEVKKVEGRILKFFTRLKRRPPNNLDEVIHELHEQAFEKIDCLQCANCCKTTSPIFLDKDIERLSISMRMKPSAFTEKYLRMDEDRDYVLQSSPCPFLAEDNYCLVYEHRPNACREYPHTNRKKMYQVLDLATKNASICPAVFDIFQNLSKRISP